MADEQNDVNQEEPALELKSARGRRFVRIFLMVAGGLAAPCLALAAFFLSGSGGDDPPAAKSGLVQSGRVSATTTTIRAKPAAPVTTTTTTAPSSPAGPPPRDPFQPLVVQAPADKTPAR
jgi:hypothetical protein